MIHYIALLLLFLICIIAGYAFYIKNNFTKLLLSNACYSLGILFILSFSLMKGELYFCSLDIIMIYALMGFIGNLAYLKYKVK